MKRRRASVAANPVLIGAVTLLVIVVGVTLAYNANKGLPFVPTFEVRVETPDAARLVVGATVQEGGQRVGQLKAIDPVRPGPDGRVGAELTLQLQTSATPLPSDTQFLISPRSTIGQKEIQLVRGTASTSLRQGQVVTTSLVPAPEIDDFFEIFDPPTRTAIRANLTYFGGALAGRGGDLNRALADLPALLGDLQTVARTLSAPSTRLTGAIRALGRFTATVAPVADSFSRGFTVGANTFDALSQDPQALRDSIAESPPTLEAGIRALPRTQPLLRALTAIGPDLQATSRQISAGAPAITSALRTGARVLPTTPPLNNRLRTTLASLRTFAAAPTTNRTLRGLQSTADTLNPTLRYLGPHITVCNYWNYFWTYLADHLAEQVPSGTVQRIEVKSAPPGQENSLMSFGATAPANGGPVDPVQKAAFGDAANLHAQPYGRAVDAQGNADCESGQRGYPTRLAQGAPAGLNIAVDPRTPGDQGPTFTGLARVPKGETFTAEPGGRAPKVAAP